MSENLNFESYLFLSPKKFIILINEGINNTEIYKKELFVENNLNQINYEILDTFLKSNIFYIEKKIKNFINKFHLIIDSDKFFITQISSKRKNNKNYLSKDEIIYSLNEIKDSCKKTLEDRKIIHMIIEKFVIDNKVFFTLPKNLKCENFSIDVKFISLSENFVKDLENILKKYQISIDKILSANYVKNFFAQDEHNLFLSSKKLIDGYNENEIQFVTKTLKNKGFFEKFFNLFS
jgi:hypothetical protein